VPPAAGRRPSAAAETSGVWRDVDPGARFQDLRPDPSNGASPKLNTPPSSPVIQ
jgi:hypothetical protein